MRRKTISAAEFKAKCLRLLDELEPEGLVITKHGRPVARVLPATTAINQRIIGSMKDQIRIRGDLFSTGVRWDVESGHTHRRRRPQRKSR